MMVKISALLLLKLCQKSQLSPAELRAFDPFTPWIESRGSLRSKLADPPSQMSCPELGKWRPGWTRQVIQTSPSPETQREVLLRQSLITCFKLISCSSSHGGKPLK